MKATLSIFALSLGLFSFSHSTSAAECTLDKKAKNSSLTEINEYYKCARPELIKRYQAGDQKLAQDYTNWKAGATGPAKPGFHGNRYLMTYVNDLGIEDYLKYAPSDVDLPVGSLIAKESFKIKGKGKLKPGPLFLMEKVGKDKAPKTDGWFYSGVKPNGKAMKADQGFCHGCHMAYKAQDALGYPAADVRIK